MLSRGPELQDLILSTLKTCSDLVGSTLGPGGMSVVIERQEVNMPPVVTKDGVTVFRALGFDDAAAQVVMEVARDAASRTASEAGDGPQPLWSKILTPNGFVKMSDVRVGMTVCGPGGTLQEVVGVFPKGKKKLVRVTFEGGRQVECCEDHLWSVTTHYGTAKTLTTREMMGDFQQVTSQGRRFKYFVPNPGPVMLRDSVTPLHPYLVGVLLGDGSLTDSGSVELSLGKAKEHIIKKLQLPRGLELKVSWVPGKNSFRVKIQGETPGGRNIRDFLDDVGIRNLDSYSKFIPLEYLLGSVDSRRSLLQGLVDTNGYINNRGRFEFSTVSDQLAEDFDGLCRSLGISLHHRLHTRENDEDSFSDNPIHRFSELKGNQFGDKIVDIKPTDIITEMQCIKVSGADHLYVTDGYILTHNTTTATILGESFIRYTQEFCRKYPHISFQRVARILQRFFDDDLEPRIEALSIPADNGTAEGRKLLHGVARVSANGDTALADATMQCFDIIGDEGNVTIVENMGPSGYGVEKIDGYPVPMGYEDCCGPFYQKFINDPGIQMCVMDKPSFLLYHGKITDFNVLFPVMSQIANEVSNGLEIDGQKMTHNVVVCAQGFSETVLANLAAGFVMEGTLNIFPLRVPPSPLKTGAWDFLADLAALTGATILDPLERPLQNFEFSHLGTGIRVFEAGRFRSNIIGHRDDILVLERVDQITKQLTDLQNSELDRTLMRERCAKLTSGIAKLIVTGSSHGEVKERRDRAEDAVCAVRGAIKHGVLPGGGVVLKHLSDVFQHQLNYTSDDSRLVATEVLVPALLEPVLRLFTNAGYSDAEAREMVNQLSLTAAYDILERKFVDPVVALLVDSTPAVLEALRNSVSIGWSLGTCGGIVAFPRDRAVDRQEARDSADFVRNSSVNEADLRP